MLSFHLDMKLFILPTIILASLGALSTDAAISRYIMLISTVNDYETQA